MGLMFFFTKETWHCSQLYLTLLLLRLLLPKPQGCSYFWKSSKPCHVGIRWIALAEFSHMSTHVPGFPSVFRFLHCFVLAKLAISSTRVALSNLMKALDLHLISHVKHPSPIFLVSFASFIYKMIRVREWVKQCEPTLPIKGYIGSEM